MEKVCWNLTNVCNEECVFCFRELLESPRSLDDNLVILDNLYNMGVRKITFAGGEPLRYPDLLDLLVHAKTLGIRTSLITNGALLNDNNISNILRFVDKLTFSIDSSVPYQNREIGRGEKHYEHIKEIMPVIRYYFPELTIEINSVAFRNNYHQLDFLYEDILSDLARYGISKWKISRFCPLRGRAKEYEQVYSLSDEEFNIIKNKYDGDNTYFPISVRDTDQINSNIIVSPNGSLKKACNNKEYTVVEDLSTFGDNPKLFNGGVAHV